jgi:NAD-reducing hydrogenase small subunit
MDPVTRPPPRRGLAAGSPGTDGTRPRIATAWLGGCSGCHMSFLDLDERLLELAGRIHLVYSPIADAKVFPEHVDVTLVEGAVANEEHLETAHRIRARSRVVIALGDCAVSGNVTAIRNALGGALPVLDRAYRDPRDARPGIPEAPGILPRLLDRVLPLHHVMRVDGFLPGCPPHPDLIHAVLLGALAGHPPDLAGKLRFG